MIEYPAKIKYSKIDNCYLVEFPDLPGCVTFGDSIEEAKSMAKEALTGYLESIDLRRLNIPGPSKKSGKDIYLIAPETKTAFAIWMKLKRIEKGLTQQKVAELLDVSFQSYQKYENPQKANPTLTTIQKIERVFNEKIINI